ncbi:hypothetical protein JK635_05900 [Neobacillus sp. YIM B02564]|uniref:Uncharacterized protein n=1 Tax=Neobacillus paridis TaxID=2803862 RepID=A0ABS1TKC7_9BACI|nr:hypothetical protein [Neobacillus paridis]MBL4951771.1 hypothetical protein [Neobacillus paridis]
MTTIRCSTASLKALHVPALTGAGEPSTNLSRRSRSTLSDSSAIQLLGVAQDPWCRRSRNMAFFPKPVSNRYVHSIGRHQGK